MHKKLSPCLLLLGLLNAVVSIRFSLLVLFQNLRSLDVFNLYPFVVIAGVLKLFILYYRVYRKKALTIPELFFSFLG